MKALIKRFLKEEDGVTAIEYGLIAGLIAVAIIAGASSVGTNLSSTFSKIGTCVSAPSSTCWSAAAPSS
ncbi:TPA: Flp family type IVb pilin [Burkholderia cepacia ATCC 25416]|uniref:Flp family type IVb pilin n=1 Tax=Burkholderia cepacia TaxID=292 RepID=UPI0009C18F43|nr:Flp family type IVb pilin [Burkholderia cepacia]HDR9768532.1 Flp family type IVb pilin [Burkholderia cepacia ATCC 25416]MCA8027673.1 Flp family type IVb pilin [Burkholderia cepacia]MCA8075742.1 Flp family type IVb pilin [Burkholderia cepacia]MCA8323496.1 Flp family type IVb pilin [Burkholderia cepacia]MDN7444446.1 Flp family type IVb pilin [Burkholderia cepacia]